MTPAGLVRRAVALLRRAGLEVRLYHRPAGLAQALAERAARADPEDPGAMLERLVREELQARRAA